MDYNLQPNLLSSAGSGCLEREGFLKQLTVYLAEFPKEEGEMELPFFFPVKDWYP